MKDKEQANKILVICGDARYIRALTLHWSQFGIDFSIVNSAAEGIRIATEQDWDAIILDLMLEDSDGFEVLRQVRKQSFVPIMMISSLDTDSDTIVALELGADDFVPKTSSSRQILARLRAILRRHNEPYCKKNGNHECLRIGILSIELPKRLASINEQILDLTATEYKLLLCLASAVGRVKTRDELNEQLRGKSYEFSDRCIDVHISTLRRKLGDDCNAPTFIKTVRGVGYMIEPSHVLNSPNDSSFSEVKNNQKSDSK